LDFVHYQQMVREMQRLRVQATTADQQRESWKVRALMAEAQLLEATAKPSNNGASQNVSDLSILRSSAIWQSGSTRITALDKELRRWSETRSSRKSGTRLSASIKEFRPLAWRRRDHLRRPDHAILLLAAAFRPANGGRRASRHSRALACAPESTVSTVSGVSHNDPVQVTASRLP